MKTLAGTASRRIHKILNWYNKRMSNSFLESLNDIIQTTNI